MRVFVKNIKGKSLMPCSPRKARILIKENKAKIIDYKPFTIQLLYATGETIQNVSIGIDTGSKHIGVALTSENKILVKGEITLRNDIKSNIDVRKFFRKNRRNRKTRHRKSRFLNRKRYKGWLPPSLQSRIDNTFFWIDKFCSLVQNPELHIEVGKFDVAKMINPIIKGEEYQNGDCKGYYNLRYYVFERDEYICQVCKKKNKILHIHHIIYRSKGGTDRVNNLITVCSDCHTDKNHKEGGILYEWMINNKKVNQYKEPPFMNSLRIKIFQKYPNAIITYGSETTPYRKNLGLNKTHYNDAIAISKIKRIKENVSEWFEIKQFRKKKRSLHEAIPRKGRKNPNITAKRNNKNTKTSKGWHLNDKVLVFDKQGWITGFTNCGCYIKDINDEYITIPNKNYKQVGFSNIKLICHNNNWQYAIHNNI